MISGLAIWIMEEEREFGEGSLIRNQRRRKSQVARAEFGAEVSSRSWAVGPTGSNGGRRSRAGSGWSPRRRRHVRRGTLGMSGSGRAPSMPPWTAAEAAALLQSVRVHGRKWAQLEREAAVPGHTAKAMRIQYHRMDAEARQTAGGEAHARRNEEMEEVGMAPVATASMPSAVAVGEEQGGAERAWDPMLGDFLAARQPVSRGLSLTGLAKAVTAAMATSRELQQWRPFTAGEGREVQRRLYQGRDWSYRLKFDALPGRPARAELFTKLWSLNKVAPGAKVIAPASSSRPLQRCRSSGGHHHGRDVADEGAAQVPRAARAAQAEAAQGEVAACSSSTSWFSCGRRRM